jgi:2-polyprenyl-6-methoxyphenol hydroxylase-like FAD-dependent oxidoreductase
MPNAKRLGERAIVIGAGVAGMGAARMLAEHFQQVTLIERDSLQEGPRTGAPQGEHLHFLLRRGVELVEQYFPGITAEMEADGIQPFDFTQDLRWMQFGEWLPRYRSGTHLYPQTRASLDRYLRKRLLALGNVEILESTAVRALLCTPDRKRVTGVQVAPRQEPGAVKDLLADLVIDASGRGTQISKWVAALGYTPPEESRLPIDLCYVSRLFQPPEGTRDWRGLWVTSLPPDMPRGGALLGVEGNRWLVSLFGYNGHHPPRDDRGFVDFSSTLLDPAIHDAIKDAKPLSDIQVFRVPEERWNHFERLEDFPAGLLVIGDAFCNFDPVFGQGMSVALMSADTLGKHLSQLEGPGGLTTSWGLSYFRACGQWIRGLWYFISAEAMRHTHVPGERSRTIRLAQWYVKELYALNHQSPEVYTAFLDLMHLKAGPEFLLRPDIGLLLARRALRPPAASGKGGNGSRQDAPPAAEAKAPGGGLPESLSLLAFGARFMGRIVANSVAPSLIGPRDGLYHHDTQAPWEPDQELGWFVRDALQAQGLQGKAGEIRTFLEYWLQAQALSFQKRALIEFSLPAGDPGLGFVLYRDNQGMSRAFGNYFRQLGLYDETVERALAISQTFRPSDMGMVRAEFWPECTARYSLAVSLQFDVTRGHSGFAERMRLLPPRFRGGAFADRVQAFSAALAPDFYPLFLGLSFVKGGALEPKMYLVRFDDRGPSLYPGSVLWRFIANMGLSPQAMEQLRALNDLIWENSDDKMTQIAIEVSESQATPKRVNLIYGGTRIPAIRDASVRFGFPESTRQSVQAFERMMQTDRVKFVAFRVTPEGLSPRFKLYGHAMFGFSDLSVCEQGGGAGSRVGIQRPSPSTPSTEWRDRARKLWDSVKSARGVR